MAEPTFNPGLGLQQIRYFEKKIHKQMRTRSLIEQLADENANSAIHRVTELTNTTWGLKAILTMIPDDTTLGVSGDNELENREAGLSAHDFEITYDQFRKAFKNEGKMADRTHWFKFGQQASDQLAYWGSDIKDRLAMNVLAGVDFKYEVDGSLRDGTCDWSQNRFAGDVSPPSANRYFRWDVGTTNQLIANDSNGNLTTADIPTWNMFVDMRTELPMMRVKPLRGKWGNGQDLYIAMVHPRVMNVIKKDPTFQENLKYAQMRGDKNPLFQGAETYLIDGILLIAHRYTFSTLGAASGNKWGAAGDVDGSRVLFLGAQALGLVEMGSPEMVTETMDYRNRVGIATSIKFGMRKIKWPDAYASNAEEDFGVVSVDVAVPAGPTNYTI